MADQPTHQSPARVNLIKAADAPFIAGRRAFLKFRDVGLADATAGYARGQIISAEQGLSEPTGWHYHTCDLQFLYMIAGWAELELDGGKRLLRMEAGEGCMLPGGTPHNECRTANAFLNLELTIPGPMGTIVCAQDATPFDRADAIRMCRFSRHGAPVVRGADDNLEFRDLGLNAASDGILSAHFVRAADRASGQGHYRASTGGVQFIYVLSGSVEIDTDAEKLHLDAGDSLVISGQTNQRTTNVSRDFEALLFTMPERTASQRVPNE